MLLNHTLVPSAVVFREALLSGQYAGECMIPAEDASAGHHWSSGNMLAGASSTKEDDTDTDESSAMEEGEDRSTSFTCKLAQTARNLHAMAVLVAAAGIGTTPKRHLVPFVDVMVMVIDGVPTLSK